MPEAIPLRNWLPPLPGTPGSKFIRVLKIAKPADPSDQEIVCSMDVIDVAQDTNFTALSYVWGVSPVTKTIQCNGNTLSMGMNCWSALWHLRNGYYSNDPNVSGGSHDTMTIWIDAICINQQDVKEKERQLKLMADIYSLARQVYVWLGEGTPESDAAIEYLRKAAFQEVLVEAGENQYEMPRSQFFYIRQAWKMFTYQVANLHAPRWKYCVEFLSPWLHSHTFCDPKAFQDICSRSWASRTWTFQEILLSPRPVLCCGTKTLSWRSFVHTMSSLALTTEAFLPAPELRWINILKLWTSVQDSGEPRNIPESQQFPLQTHLWEYHLFIDATRMALMFIKAATLYLVILTILFGVRFSREDWGDSELLKASRSSEAWITEFIFYLASVWVLPVLVFLLLCALVFSLIFILLFRSREKEHMSYQKYRKSPSLTFIDVRDAIIYEIVTRKVTNPKDKSFGMRAIFSKIGIQLDNPDYDKDIYQIYRELFVRLSDWSKSLRLLLLCHTSTTSTLPSWMPNWDIDPEKTWLNPDALDSGGGSSGVFFRTRAHWSLTDNEELVVRGVHVCRISWSCGRFYETSTTDYMSDEQSHINNISMIHGLMRRYKAGRWTPTTDSDRHHALLHWERNNDPRKDKRILKEWGQMMRCTSTMSDSSILAFAYLKSHPECFEFHIDMCNDLAKRERTLFLTEPDILGMGNGPTNIQVTDLVTLVAGVSKPLILESRDTRYRLKGFAEMENEGHLASRAHGLNTSKNPLRGGWEDLGVEMQPRDEIVIC